MPYNGSGTYSLPALNPVVTGTVISSPWANNTLNDIATALSTAVLKNGAQIITANIPFANNRLTGIGAGSAGTDAAQLQQVQGGSSRVLTSVAGTNTITAVLAPVITSYANGQLFELTPANTNTAATTIAIDGLAAKNVFAAGGACVGGELVAGVPVLIEYDGTQFQIIGRMGNIAGNMALRHFAVGAIVRCTGGVMTLLNNGTHHPMGATGISEPNAYTTRIAHRTATFVNTGGAYADDVGAAVGLQYGVSIGLSFVDITAHAPFTFNVDGQASPVLSCNALWATVLAGGGIVVTKVSASTVRVTHPAAVSGDGVTVSIASAAFTPDDFVLSYNTTQIDIIARALAGGAVAYGGASWSQTASRNITAPTFTWTGSNTLRVDHGVSGTSACEPQLTSLGGVYVCVLFTVGATYFEVAFLDYAGVQVTTQDVNMQFTYERDFLVVSTWPTAAQAIVARGNLAVPNYAQEGLGASNNFQYYGVYEY